MLYLKEKSIEMAGVSSRGLQKVQSQNWAWRDTTLLLAFLFHSLSFIFVCAHYEGNHLAKKSRDTFWAEVTLRELPGVIRVM